MKRNNLKARITYDKKEDAYKLMLSQDGGETWNLCKSCACKRSEEDLPEEEPMFIYVGLIDELKKAILCGYEIVY